MDIKALPMLILTIILVGVVIGVGLIVFDKFSTAVAPENTITGEEITWGANEETIELAHGNITSFLQIYNATNDVVDQTNYSVDLSTGVITINDQITCADEETCYASYLYREYATITDSVLDSASTEISNISTSWLGLIITIIVMSILIGIVLTSFAVKMRR